MKKLWILAFLASTGLMAQVSNPGVRYVASAPSGACPAAPPIQILKTTGAVYTCDNGTWAAIGGGGGGGTVNSGTGERFAWYATTGTTIDSNPHLDDGLTNASFLTYSGTGGIVASAGDVRANGNLQGLTNGSEVKLGTNFIQYAGYGNGIIAMLNGSSTELTRMNFGTNTNGSVALCLSGTTMTVCGGDGTAVGTLVAPVVQSGNGATKTCGATIVVTNGIVTSC